MTSKEWLQLVPMMLMLIAVFGIPVGIVVRDIRRQTRALRTPTSIVTLEENEAA